MKFKLESKFKPAGDQPEAIKALTEGLLSGARDQTLLGVTGSGKTFTVANVIEHTQKPTLVIAHNKTLAAQLAQEYRDFFPDAAVHYFVSYYDFYQPEAYIPTSDTYIEKDASINQEIDRLRHSSTQALLTRSDVIVVASVSCIYGLGNPEEYGKFNLKIEKGASISRSDFIRDLIRLYYERTNADLTPGTFRSIGNSIEIMPPNERLTYRISIESGAIESLSKIDPVNQAHLSDLQEFFLFPRKHFVSSKEKTEHALMRIEEELKDRLAHLKRAGRILEHERLNRRTRYDLALIREIGYCSGIENYSRHFDGRAKGEPPHTLLSYFPHKTDGSPNFLTIIDESHVTVPQIRGMYAGDKSRKETLIEHGFRLPSALDNRPLRFDEFRERVGPILYTSATPADYEIEESSGHVVEQIIRPTGLIDPEIVVRGIIEMGEYGGQVKDVIAEAVATIEKGDRVLLTTLTKKMAEDLSEYLKKEGLRAEYLHSGVKTLERIEILTRLRRGSRSVKGEYAQHRADSSGAGFDVLVGVNLLREGLDLPEVSLIGILDADKEGFLRSETALVQTIGRAARNVDGRVILYADRMTGSIERAISETSRRRDIQLAYNKKHGITPKTIKKTIADITDQLRTEHAKAVVTLLSVDMELFKKAPKKFIKEKEKKMNAAVKILDFETAAILRDEIKELEKRLE